MMVNTLVNLQDPILKTPENPTTPVDASVSLQDLQEPIVVSLAASPSLERARLQEPIVASSSVTPPPERMHPQVPIITPSLSWLLLQNRCVLSSSRLHLLFPMLL
jgi:hypothetical protein